MRKIGGKSVAGTYMAMEAVRAPYLERARQVAELTLPAVLPREGYTGSHLATPYQSVGSKGAASLAAKQLMALFPPGQSMMRYQMDPAAEEVLSQGDPDVKAEVESSLAKTEKAMDMEIESKAMRPRLHQALIHRAISGNYLIRYLDSGNLKGFPLDRFVIKRDQEGNVLLVITKESVSRAMLDEATLAQLEQAGSPPDNKQLDINDNGLDIYTAIHRMDKNTFEVWQEIEGVEIVGTYGTYPVDELPWIPLRGDASPGMDYSYGYMSALLGDLASLEGLTKALVDNAAASSRLVFLVSPNSSTNLRDLQNAPNGGFVQGNEEDVKALKTDKAADMSVAFNMIERLTTSLGFAFLLNQSVQRDGERVTAEEIRFLAQEIEDVQAGDYSLMAQDLQLPLARLMLQRLEREKQVPVINKDLAKPTIVTGLEALSRGHDLRKMEMLLGQIVNLVGPAGVGKYTNLSAAFKRFETALGLSGESIIKGAEEIQAAEQQEQMQAAIQSMGPEVIKQMGAQQQQPQQA